MFFFLNRINRVDRFPISKRVKFQIENRGFSLLLSLINIGLQENLLFSLTKN